MLNEFKKGAVLSTAVHGEVTRIELLTHVTKRGRATVRILEHGILEAKDGHVIKGFEVIHGCLKHWEIVEK